MKQDKKYTLIVPTYNRPELLDEFLKSLEVQKFNPDDFEILIIDNNSENNVKKQLDGFVNKNPVFSQVIKYVHEPKQGVGYCWNTGILQAQGQLLIFTDDDAALHYDYFKTISEDFKLPIENIAGGGHVSPVFEHQKPAWIYKYIMPVFAEINLGKKSKFPKNKHPFGSNMIISKDVFEKVGKFDHNIIKDLKVIPPGILEKEFFSRVKKSGIPVYYFHDLVVWHFIPQEKMSKDYVKDQIVESMRIKKDISREKGFFSYLLLLGKEIFKWFAAFFLWFYYILSSQWEKASMLLRIRRWKTKELLGFT